MMVYVNDLLITRNNTEMIKDLKLVLKGSFMMKDLNTLRYFLGIKIARNEHGLVLNQCKYAMDLISDLGLTGSKPITTPMDYSSKLTTAEYDKLFKFTQNDNLITDVTEISRYTIICNCDQNRYCI